MGDRLHQPYRLPLPPRRAELIETAYERGAAGACLSGAGPSVLAICDSPITAHSVEKAWNAAGMPGMATRLRFDTARCPPDQRRRSCRGALTDEPGHPGRRGQEPRRAAPVRRRRPAGQRPVAGSRSSAPTGPARRRCSRSSPATSRPTTGTVARGKDLVIGYLRQEVAESRGRTVLAEVLAGAGAVTGIERRMRHIELEMAECDRAEDELAELMDEYGRLQHRFEQLGGWSTRGGGAAHPGRPGLRRGRHGARHRRVLRRLDDARRAGPPAAAEPGPAPARRADQPPGPGIGRMAAGLPGRLRRRGPPGQPRPGLHQRRRQPGRRAARRQPDRVRRRLRRLRRAARRADRPARAPGRRRRDARSRRSSASSSGSATRSHQGAPGAEPDQGARSDGAGGRAIDAAASRSSSASPSRRAAAGR